jgi:predicted N-formylglutamate amidohydrolase
MRTGASIAAADGRFDTPVMVLNPRGRGRAVLVCEHASNRIPADYGDLGLSESDRCRHIAWDPGALPLAQRLAELLDTPLVHATYSRLLLDVNRSLTAHDSIVTRSEATAIPGNQALNASERELRQRHLYAPFHAALDEVIGQRLAQSQPTAVISIHSFTPSYHGVPRPWQVGVIAQHDRRLANSLLAALRSDAQLCVGDNQPYAPGDGVFHTLERHAESRGLPCVMIEVRNDLIDAPTGQHAYAQRLFHALDTALASLTDTPSAFRH